MNTDNKDGQKSPMPDLEIKDTQLIFQDVWGEMETEIGRENLVFPKEIFWLNGAPGSGKGTHTRFIQHYREVTEETIVVSDLLQSPESRKRIDSGMLVGDREVIQLVFRRLLDPIFSNGAIVDGYPRTKTQSECLKLLYNKLNELRTEYKDTPSGKKFRKPTFHIIVLFIDEKESIKRQLLRGQMALQHNEEVRETGIGTLLEIRKTDIDPEASRNRYRTFKEQTFEALQSLREIFQYHFINAKGTIEEVQQRIIKELQYQGSLELRQDTYDRLSNIPLASEVVFHARQQLIERLDDYEEAHQDLFKQVVSLVESKIIPVIIRQAISGVAHLNIEDEIFENPRSKAMLVDILSERGFRAAVWEERKEIPSHIDPQTFKIHTLTKKVYNVVVKFAGTDIRRIR